MKHKNAQPKLPGSFYQFSLTCNCDPDRLIQDHQGDLFCGDCVQQLEKVSSADLPDYDRKEIVMKLKLQKKIASETGEFELSAGDIDDLDD